MRRAVCPRPQALAGVGHPAAPLSLVGSALWEAPAPPSPAKCPWARCADLLQTGAFGGPFPLWGSRRLCPCPRVWRSVVLGVCAPVLESGGQWFSKCGPCPRVWRSVVLGVCAPVLESGGQWFSASVPLS